MTNNFSRGTARFRIVIAFIAAMFFSYIRLYATEPQFDWQHDYARVTATGDIEWTPQPFKFVAGEQVRYIDFESGIDSDDGTRQKPWKHHPWDRSATDQAAAAARVDTYIFKGGVTYRGQLTVREHGRQGTPIRLTRDPSWGVGPATIAGSERVTGWTQGVDRSDIPDSEKVWQANLGFSPRTLWMIGPEEKNARRIPLARHPNWTSQPEDHKAEWFTWTNDPHPFNPREGFSANDRQNLQGREAEFVKDALLYSEFGWVMGTPYPTRVMNFDPSDGSVRFANWTGGGNASIIFRGMRYHLEDKPHYLDDPQGEFWFDRQGRDGGKLYVRVPDGVNPNDVDWEAGRLSDLILGDDVQHLEISGLDFRWTTQPWDLDVASWDYSTKPFGTRSDAEPACIRFWGAAESLRIANCRFDDVVMGVRLRAIGANSPIRNITLEDNVFRNVDVGAAHFTDGAGWGFANPVGVLDDVRLYRNHATNIGFRPTRYERGTAFDLSHPIRAHIAGNVVERCAAQAINVRGGKGAIRGDVPLVRVLIHQNKAWKTMQNGNDFGGIESWQHGPVYIFNNLSFDPRGQQESHRTFHKQASGFGHAYYLDGGFKHYVFNNIAWGLSNDPTSPLVNCAAFQEIYSHQNLFFNNTAYNFTVGSRRQTPHAGRNKYLGNVWQGMSERVFRHADPAKTQADGNAADAGAQKQDFAYESNAYARNVFHDVGQLGVYEASGRWLQSLDDFRAALRDRQSLSAELGTIDKISPLRDPAKGDFRLNDNSHAVDYGATAFVPWALHAVVAEWNFYPAGDDATRIIDEHWYPKDFMTDRAKYYMRPTYPLEAIHVEREDYIDGPLENFTGGALRLSANKKSYARLKHAALTEPFTAELATQASHGQSPQPREFTFEGESLQNANIFDSNFLIEVYFKAESDGLLISKQQDAGYALRIKEGRATFSVTDAKGASAKLSSNSRLDDGRWHHVIAEADRGSRTLTLYVDGTTNVTGTGLGNVSLTNAGDLYVGGTPEGEYLNGVLEFLRISRGTLADAHTTIEELYAWQFDGPAHRDMRGANAIGDGRDAGALESF